MIIEDELAAIRERADKTTEGPWEAAPNDRILGPPRPEHAGERAVAETALHRDAPFIAHARQDLPRLLDAVQRVLGLYRLAVTDSDSDDQTVRAEVRGYNAALDEVRRAIGHALNGDH